MVKVNEGSDNLIKYVFPCWVLRVLNLNTSSIGSEHLKGLTGLEVREPFEVFRVCEYGQEHFWMLAGNQFCFPKCKLFVVPDVGSFLPGK